MNDHPEDQKSIVDYKERFKRRALPVCKSYCNKPDIKIGYYRKADAYWLYCGTCDQFGLEAVKKEALSEDEQENAVELKSVKNRPEIPENAYPICKPPDHEPDIKVGYRKSNNSQLAR